MMTSSGIFNIGARFFECDGTSLSEVAAAPNAANDSSFYGNFVVLPTGQILFTDFFFVSVYNPSGTYNPAWAPQIQSAPTHVAPGGSYSISGFHFNGMSEGAAYETISNPRPTFHWCALLTTEPGTCFIAGRTTTPAWLLLPTIWCLLNSMYRQRKSGVLANLLSSRTESLPLRLPLRWIEIPTTSFAQLLPAPLSFCGSVLSDHYCPSGVETSVPGGGLNSTVDAGIGARV